jgi:hypothetical protein
VKKPLEDVDLPNQEKVRLLFLPESEIALDDDLSAWAIALLAERSPSFAFLADPREDIYTLEDEQIGYLASLSEPTPTGKRHA